MSILSMILFRVYASEEEYRNNIFVLYQISLFGVFSSRSITKLIISFGTLNPNSVGII